MKHLQAQELAHSFHLAVLLWEGELSKGWWVPGRSGLLAVGLKDDIALGLWTSGAQ